MFYHMCTYNIVDVDMGADKEVVIQGPYTVMLYITSLKLDLAVFIVHACICSMDVHPLASYNLYMWLINYR